MNRLKLHIVLLFLVALATGVVAGMAISRNSMASHQPTERRSYLANQLDLTPAQSDRLRAIWSEVIHPSTQPGLSNRERRDSYRDQRDQAVVALLSDSQKAAYDDIQKKYRQQIDGLDEERRQATQVAVEKTREILTDVQRAKYDEILKNAPPGRRGHGGGGPSTRHNASTPPTTQASPNTPTTLPAGRQI
jgi:Spy/CpxP family protein refolding chaperone